MHRFRRPGIPILLLAAGLVAAAGCRPSEAAADALVALPYSGEGVSGTAQVFVPSHAGDGTAAPRPVLLLLDPGGSAAGIVRRWQPTASRLGWILASTPAIRNGTADAADLGHLVAMLQAIQAKWPVDRRAVALDGLSGGACGAYRAALVRPDLFRGAIVECGHMGSYRTAGARARPGMLFFVFTRSGDFNKPASEQLARTLWGDGATVMQMERPGGHEPMGDAEMYEALHWLDEKVRAR